MPASGRSKRSSFGGSLLSVPAPLPDDEPPGPAHVAEESAPVTVSPSVAPDAPPETLPPEPPPSGATSPAVGERPNVHPARPSRERPPGTIRLGDQAARQLWEAYIETKQADPFLSYRQFASGVVLDGLALYRRRQKRATP